MNGIAILNGTVIDGTGTGRFRADVLISGDRIAAVGDLSADTDAQRIDASGMTVAPGFVDTHTPHRRLAVEDPPSARQDLPGIHHGSDHGRRDLLRSRRSGNST